MDRKMKAKEGFLLRQIGSDYVLIPFEETGGCFQGVISINEVGAFIWNRLQEEISFEDLVGGILQEYDVKEAVAREDAEEFLELLNKNGMLVQG